MEQFICEIEVYARATGRKPQSILRAAAGTSWNTWDLWRAGKASPTMAVADRVRAYMAAHPPAAADPAPASPSDAA